VKISDIEIGKKLILKFVYKELEFSMAVDIIQKEKDCIIITAILENGITLEPSLLTNISLMYIVKDGIFTFQSCNFQVMEYNKMRSYAVSCDEDVVKENRRDAYRVFIGEIVKIRITPTSGAKFGTEGILKNISANGMGIILKREIKVGSKMSILYNFEGLNIHLLGEVIRAQKVPGRNYFDYGCKFYNANSMVNRVIMVKQMRTSKKGVQKTQK
jgi:c-di-GMP-binding flagellar brake protein YcgR